MSQLEPLGLLSEEDLCRASVVKNGLGLERYQIRPLQGPSRHGRCVVGLRHGDAPRLIGAMTPAGSDRPRVVPAR
jgi:hypothetical protein